MKASFGLLAAGRPVKMWHSDLLSYLPLKHILYFHWSNACFVRYSRLTPRDATGTKQSGIARRSYSAVPHTAPELALCAASHHAMPPLHLTRPFSSHIISPPARDRIYALVSCRTVRGMKSTAVGRRLPVSSFTGAATTRLSRVRS